MTKVIFFTGAGISHESGLQTFRGEGGLWNGQPVEAVCSVAAWKLQPDQVLAFYNGRRREVREAEPNAAHRAIAALKGKDYDVAVITQNVDDLHERAGSKPVIHLHGEIMKMRSDAEEDDELVDCHGDIRIGDCAPNGHQYRPHVIFFGEGLPPFEWHCAQAVAAATDILVVVGTSLQVYPAARIPTDSKAHTIIVVDPDPPVVQAPGKRVVRITAPATVGVPEAIARIRAGEFTR